MARIYTKTIGGIETVCAVLNDGEPAPTSPVWLNGSSKAYTSTLTGASTPPVGIPLSTISANCTLAATRLATD